MSEELTLEWPPAYIIKQHPRAKHVKLKVSVQHGLEIVVPPRFNHHSVTDLLESNRAWIEKHVMKTHSRRLQDNPQVLPKQLMLLALEQVWQVDYLKSLNKNIRIYERPNKELVLVGNVDSELLCKQKITEWLKQKAKQFLIPQLSALSEQTDLRYTDVSIRSQQARWGSCSAEKSINLNYKLLFLPPELVRHILIHELCHLAHLNHGPRFWRLVASFDKEWKQHCKHLRNANEYIPLWVS